MAAPDFRWRSRFCYQVKLVQQKKYPKRSMFSHTSLIRFSCPVIGGKEDLFSSHGKQTPGAIPELNAQGIDVPERPPVSLVFPWFVMNVPIALFLVLLLQLHRAVVVFDHVPHERHTTRTCKRDAACLI